MAMGRFKRAIHYRQVPLENPGALHALPGDRYQVDVRCTDVEHLIQGDVRLDVVRCRRWKTCRHLEQAERQFPTALADRS
ncbi:hypothetical protein D3C81_1872170 [compost metagenome]